MPIANTKKILLLHLLLGCFFIGTVDIVYADAETDGQWHILETTHAKIRYHSFKDLKDFNEKIDYSSGLLGIKGLFSKKSSDDLANKIQRKIDAVYERVQEILDMRKLMKKVIVNIYHNKKELHAAYYEIFKKPCRFRAWYIYEWNTIFVRADDIHEGMLAHEIAHSIIDHYLSVRPPQATAEILARYVDGHLFD
jgi:hypothetical protein